MINNVCLSNHWTQYDTVCSRKKIPAGYGEKKYLQALQTSAEEEISFGERVDATEEKQHMKVRERGRDREAPCSQKRKWSRKLSWSWSFPKHGKA